MWRALHIFYYEKHDELLVCGIRPILKKYNVNEFFFIRYWEKGPHIRLRIKIDSNEIFECIQKDIENFITFNKSESLISEQYYRKIAEQFAKKEKIENVKDQSMMPDNTVCEMQYLPEYEKYYGKDGVTLAEKEFCFSSALAFNVIALAESKSGKMYYGAAYAMALVDTVFEDENDRKKFFSVYTGYWERYSEIIEENIKKMHESAVEVDSILLRNIEAVLKENTSDFHRTLFAEIGTDRKKITRLLINFIHLFNNRIGVSTYEEVQIGLICMKAYDSGCMERV